MSVATDLVPEVYIPERARVTQPRRSWPTGQPTPGRPGPGRPDERRPGPDATVVRLWAPAPNELRARLRLTRRGVVALAVLVAAVAATLVGLAAVSAPGGSGAPAGPLPATVVVHPGDTLWSIASRVAPGTDPRLEVADLQQRNHLPDAALRPGQVLRVR